MRYNKELQTDKGKLSCLLRAQKPRQLAFVAELGRYASRPVRTGVCWVRDNRVALATRTRHLSSMPTALRVGPYRFFFFSSDRVEPRPVHVERDASRANFWLDPVRLADSGGFGGVELNRIVALVEEHREQLVRAWDEYFSE